MLLDANRISQIHSRYFDMWRGGAALAVASAHAFQIYGTGYSPFLSRFFSALAGAAVMAFFALSGFFIHKSLVRCFSDASNWRSFLKARADRILPPFAVCLVLTVFLWFLAPHVFSSGTREFLTPTNRVGYYLDGLWRTVLFLSNFFGPALSANGPLWSLTYEVWYYALACLYYMAYRGLRVGWIAIPLTIILTYLDVWFAIFGLVWLGGFAVSVLQGTDWIKRLVRVPVLLLPIVLLVALFVVQDSLVGKVTTLFHLAFGGWMVLHFASMLDRSSVPEIPLLVWSGSFSYSLYVIHFPILLFFYGIYEGAGFFVLVFIFLLCALIGPAIERFKL